MSPSTQFGTGAAEAIRAENANAANADNETSDFPAESVVGNFMESDVELSLKGSVRAQFGPTKICYLVEPGFRME
jgi:hypothetical protein